MALTQATELPTVAAKQSLVGKCAAAAALVLALTPGHLIAIFPPWAPHGPRHRCRQAPVESRVSQHSLPPPYVSLRHSSHCNRRTKSERRNKMTFSGQNIVDSLFFRAYRSTYASGELEHFVGMEQCVCVWGGWGALFSPSVWRCVVVTGQSLDSSKPSES